MRSHWSKKWFFIWERCLLSQWHRRLKNSSTPNWSPTYKKEVPGVTVENSTTFKVSLWKSWRQHVEALRASAYSPALSVCFQWQGFLQLSSDIFQQQQLQILLKALWPVALLLTLLYVMAGHLRNVFNLLSRQNNYVNSFHAPKTKKMSWLKNWKKHKVN